MEKKSSGAGAFEQAAREIEAEVKRILELIETRMVPRARRNGEKVLRRVAEELKRLADHLQEPPAGDSTK